MKSLRSLDERKADASLPSVSGLRYTHQTHPQTQLIFRHYCYQTHDAATHSIGFPLWTQQHRGKAATRGSHGQATIMNMLKEVQPCRANMFSL